MKHSLCRSFAVFMTALVLISVLLLSSCLPALPEGFSEEDVTAQAEEAVKLMSEEKYAEVAAQFSEELYAVLDEEKLESALGAPLALLGEFNKVKSSTVFGKDGYAVAVLVCQFFTGEATFTISIDADDRICGMYMK